ncbi:hypothetical protein MTR_8g090360 [Medicago truncatula]|uniref:Uncharacterized protein n=1 Tax=Medicago truncatula TaxID=3880 RepID=A0A072U4X2_MEDTR|nr:hypothetical protein MTR_8g090360 [Medicago truncatula]
MANEGECQRLPSSFDERSRLTSAGKRVKILEKEKGLHVGIAMGIQWAGYYSTHPHTRVCKKYSYSGPYPRGQLL